MMLALLIFVCIASFAALVWKLRSDGISLGIPIAYLFGLLLIHVPGAIAHMTGEAFFSSSEPTELGMTYATVGAICFVAGVWIARRLTVEAPAPRPAARWEFWIFCFAGGWFFTYTLGGLQQIPTLGAAIVKGGAIWMLGNMLGLRDAIARKRYRWMVFWLLALAAFPIMTTLIWGFLSYGSAATIIVLCILVVSIRSNWKVTVGLIVGAVLGFNAFLSYFKNREDMRDSVWGGASMEERVDAALGIFRDFEWYDSENEAHLTALDVRLNQNHFVGLAATRIANGDSDYLYGQSIRDGFISLVPRVLWPDKPVMAGSGTLVAELTGLQLSDEASWGIGNVMEFQVNFGLPGVVAGFLLLGWLLGWLDRRAAMAEINGDLGMTIIYFLPAIALIQPNGSMVELVGGGTAALIAAYGWRWTWLHTYGATRTHGETRSTVPRNP